MSTFFFLSLFDFISVNLNIKLSITFYLFYAVAHGQICSNTTA